MKNTNSLKYLILFLGLLFLTCDISSPFLTELQDKIEEELIPSYTVSFDKNADDAAGTMDDLVLAENATANLNANAFTRSGWSFSGWSLTPAGSVVYGDGAEFTMGSADVTLYARWNQVSAGETDFSASSVEPLFSGGNIVGIRLVLENTGETAETVLYQIFFSEDSTISKITDIKIYEDSALIPAGGEKQIDLSTETDINPYIHDNLISITGGDYYIGIIVDPDDDFSETSETNNEAVSSTTYPVEAVYLDGSVTVTLSNGTEGQSVYFGIAPTGTMDFEASGAGLINNGGTVSIDAFDIGDGVTSWVATGGAEYDLYLFIDVNDNYTPGPDQGPDAGDLTMDTITFGPVDGDETVPIDASDMYYSGSVRCELDYPEAAGGDIVFLVARVGVDTEVPDPTSWIEASVRTTVDGAGIASGTLMEGVDLTEMYNGDPAYNSTTDEIFYPEDDVSYFYAAAIDMGDVLWLKWNDPYDYNGFFGDPPTFVGGQQSVLSLTSANFQMIGGIAVEASGFGTAEFDNYDILYALSDPADPGNILGTGAILWSDRSGGDSNSVVMNNDFSHAWSSESAWGTDLTLMYFLDKDGNGDLSSGDLMNEMVVSIPADGAPRTVTLSAIDLAVYASGTTYFYSDTGTPVISLDFSDENTFHDDTSSAIPPFEGNNALEVEFSFNPLEFCWFDIYVRDNLRFAENPGGYNLTFRMNLSQVSGMSSLGYTVWDNNSEMGGLNFMVDTDTVNPDYVVEAPGANGWGLYSIPLTGGDTNFSLNVDINNLSHMAIGSPNDVNGDPFHGIVFFDDMRFEPISP
ncbi:MAG: InlB B-repeat-containing protein [Spirochaetales bacterium]|nr:InlB B-repeat-containing protein [Spirochaetales bacterium]